MEVLTALNTVAFSIDATLQVALLVTHLRLILEHGRHPSAPMAELVRQ